jgi:hypothetical protein
VRALCLHCRQSAPDLTHPPLLPGNRETGSTHTFNHKYPGSGAFKLIELSALPAGYLVNDTMVVTATITVEREDRFQMGTGALVVQAPSMPCRVPRSHTLSMMMTRTRGMVMSTGSSMSLRMWNGECPASSFSVHYNHVVIRLHRNWFLWFLCKEGRDGLLANGKRGGLLALARLPRRAATTRCSRASATTTMVVARQVDN